MEMARERQAEEVPDDNTYLVCPLSDDTIEEIRAKAYKSREKKILAQKRKLARLRKREIEKRDLKELRRQRKAGVLLPDSGISETDTWMEELLERVEALNDPLLSTQFVRRELYYKLSRKQMQRVLARYYGWEKWSEDPWGSYPKFCEWIDSACDNEMAVWAVNETSMGRLYLALGIVEGLAQLDYSKMTEKDLEIQLGYGAGSFLHVKNYTGWDDWGDFKLHYPKEPLPVRLVNERVNKVYPFDSKPFYSGMTFPLPQKPDGTFDIPERVPDNPFEEIEDFFSMFLDPRNYGPLSGYRFLVSGIYLWPVVWLEISKRLHGYPGAVSLIGYKSATKPSIADIAQKLAPKGERLPSKGDWWKEIYGLQKEFQETLAKKYQPKSQIYSETYKGKKVKDVNAEQALIDGVEYYVKQTLAQLIRERSKVDFSLKLITESNLINTLVKEAPQFAEFRKALRKAQKKIKPTSQIEKADLLEQIKDLRYKIGTKEPLEPSEKELVKLIYKDLLDAKAPLSLDREDEDKDGDTCSLLDTIEDKRTQEPPEQIEERELLKAINKRWSPRERLVMSLYSEGENDRGIALALEGKFGKSSSEESVRQLRKRARDKAKQVRDEMESS